MADQVEPGHSRLFSYRELANLFPRFELVELIPPFDRPRDRSAWRERDGLPELDFGRLRVPEDKAERTRPAFGPGVDA